jgi:membrane protein implicated in regulation of membrane protease activity
MENLQIKLTVLLLLIEVVAFAWLITDIQKSKKNQNKIIELEHQILKVEGSIMELERTIVDKIDVLIDTKSND